MECSVLAWTTLVLSSGIVVALVDHNNISFLMCYHIVNTSSNWLLGTKCHTCFCKYLVRGDDRLRENTLRVLGWEKTRIVFGINCILVKQYYSTDDWSLEQVFLTIFILQASAGVCRCMLLQGKEMGVFLPYSVNSNCWNSHPFIEHPISL